MDRLSKMNDSKAIAPKSTLKLRKFYAADIVLFMLTNFYLFFNGQRAKSASENS